MSGKSSSRLKRIFDYVNRTVNPVARMKYLREKQNERTIEEINDH